MVLPLAAIGASAVSQLYKSATGQSASTPFQPASTSSTQPTSADSNKLQIPTKLSSDISALLLSLQSASGTNASASSGSTTSTATATGAATDPNAAVQANLQNVLGDLQKAGGHHHHHHGGGQPGNDASTTTTTTTTTTTADADAQPSSSAGLFGQLSKALSAYASQTAAGATASTAGLLTA